MMVDKYTFRGKQKYDGLWLVGDLCRRDGIYIFTPDGLDSYDHYEVDPATVGQSTGMVDKHGVLVFEGDIVKFVHPSPDVLNGTGIVIWNGDELGWEFRDPGSLEWYNGYSGDLYDIIGNIHDNPELFGDAP